MRQSTHNQIQIKTDGKQNDITRYYNGVLDYLIAGNRQEFRKSIMQMSRLELLAFITHCSEKRGANTLQLVYNIEKSIQYGINALRDNIH
jgi:hypothetical protein